MTSSVPTAILTDAIGEAIAGRRVVTAVFTTFSFDPGFFELNVLPVLFDRPFSQIEKIRRIQLEEAVRGLHSLAVYYDRSALAPDASPALLPYERIDVRRRNGLFHPKVALILVENPTERLEAEDGSLQVEGAQRTLIVCIMSSNLTRSGWWENVEAFHVEQIADRTIDRSRISYRKDLLGLLRRIRDTAPAGESHRALDVVRDFVLHGTRRAHLTRSSYDGQVYTRIYCGQASLPDWFMELRLSRWEWNLEVISPFFDAGASSTLSRLLEVLHPRETRVYLPRDPDGTASVTEVLFASVAAQARWANLPSGLLREGRQGGREQVAPRRVHAKVYRLWSRDAGEVVLVGSVNCTSPAHSGGVAGNLEAAFLVDLSSQKGQRQWWLEPLDYVPTHFLEQPFPEEEKVERPVVDLSLSFDWLKEKLSYRIEGPASGPLEVSDLTGRRLFVLDSPDSGEWIDCGEVGAATARELLKTSSFVRCVHPLGEWRVLIREENTVHRPWLIANLTPEEILYYWSLLSPDQRTAFLEKKLEAESQLEGLSAIMNGKYKAENTLFDRFAGVYHAFERLLRFIEDALLEGKEQEAQARLFGAKYDSLPVLLHKTLTRLGLAGPVDGSVAESEEPDPILGYVTFLCGVQARDRIRVQHPEFWRQHRDDARPLELILERLPEVRDLLPLDLNGIDQEFLCWYEEMFLDIAPKAPS